MSYTIEYDSFFFQSGKNTYIPMWFSGDNNVYETNRRRARSWSIFMGLFDVSKEQLDESIKPMLGRYNQHWKRHGKWVDDKALIRWIKNGVKNAMTLEEFLTANKWRSLSCELRVYDTDTVYETYQNQAEISTNTQFSEWIRSTKSLMQMLEEQHVSFYPIIRIYGENIRKKKISHHDIVLIKNTLGYLKESTDKSTTWSKCPTEAMELSAEQAQKLIEEKDLNFRYHARLIDSVSKHKPYDAILMFADGAHEGQYVLKCTQTRIFLTYNANSAFHYQDTKAAKKAIEKIGPRFESHGTLMIINHKKEEI